MEHRFSDLKIRYEFINVFYTYLDWAKLKMVGMIMEMIVMGWKKGVYVDVNDNTAAKDFRFCSHKEMKINKKTS